MADIAWDSLSWRRPGAEKHCSVIVTGDWAPIRRFGEVMAEEPARVYGDTLGILRGTDCRIVNLESPLAGGTPTLKDGPNLHGGREHLVAFDLPGFDAATLGNNHSLDFGAPALAETLSLLEKRGVGRVGAGMDLAEATRPLVLEVRGLKLGIVNFTEGNDRSAAKENAPGVFGWDTALAEKLTRELKTRCDFVLVIPHAGAEYVPFPPAYIREAYRRLADAGADAIVAHHPHVPQGIEFRNTAPIFYSLGNYVFHQPVKHYYRKIGFLAELELDARGALAGFRLHPYRIGGDGVDLLRGGELSEFAELMRKLSEAVSTRGDEAWNAVLKERWHRNYVSDTLWGPLEKLEREPRLGAAKLLNRFTTPAHRAFYTDVLGRVAAGTVDDAPEDLYQLAVEYNEHLVPPEQ